MPLKYVRNPEQFLKERSTHLLIQILKITLQFISCMHPMLFLPVSMTQANSKTNFSLKNSALTVDSAFSHESFCTHNHNFPQHSISPWHWHHLYPQPCCCNLGNSQATNSMNTVPLANAGFIFNVLAIKKKKKQTKNHLKFVFSVFHYAGQPIPFGIFLTKSVFYWVLQKRRAHPVSNFPTKFRTDVDKSFKNPYWSQVHKVHQDNTLLS